MTERTIIIPFRGPRTYLQGAELMTAAVDAMGGPSAVSDLDFSAREMIWTSELTLSIKPAEPGFVPQSAVTLRCKKDDAFYWVLIQPSDAKRDAPREDCNQSEIMRSTAVSENEARYENELDHPLIDCLVSMKKQLLQALFPEEKGKWIFCRAVFSDMPATFNTAKVECKTDRPSRIYQSNIVVDERSLGKMYFVLQ